MATLSSPGIGTSGLDVKSIITQLVALEKRPLDTLKLQAATTSTKISAFGQIKSLVSTLSDAASKLTSVTGWNNVAVTSSDKDFVSATAVGGTLATSFNVEVQALAKSQSTASKSISGGVGAGTLTIQLGRWGTASVPGVPGVDAFTANGSVAAVDITVSASDTVADVASKINGSNAGVTATILTDASGQRLLLRSKETGLESGFQLTVSEGADTVPNSLGNTDNSGLSRLATAQIDGAATQIAANAKATVNGILVESGTNTFANSVAGVTFKAEKVTDPLKPPITISVAKDTSAVQANVEAFVKAYNEVNKILNESTKVDKESKSIGLLQGDSTALGLQSALRSAMQAVSPGSTVYQRLADIGVVQKTSSDPMATAALGGELTVDTAKLNKALTDNPEEVKKFFRGDSNVATNGLAVKMKTLTAGMLATDGFFKSKDSVLQASLKRNEKDQASVNAKVNNFEKRITARYSALDTQMSSLNALNAYVSQQVTSWNKSTG